MPDKKQSSIVARIKKNIEKASSGKRFEGQLNVQPGADPKRVRFISDFDDAIEIKMHSLWKVWWPTVCYSYFGKECLLCDKEGTEERGQTWKTIPQYAWTVRDLKEKKNYVLCVMAGGRSPVPYMLKRWEKFGNLTDRPYLISITGKGQNKSWDLVPDGEPREWAKQVAPFTKEEVYAIIAKAGGPQDSADSDEEGESAPGKEDKGGDD